MILRDPVHGLVSFESEEQQIVPALLEAGELQRLRRVHQLGLTSLAYPGAGHSRFSHALGTAHVMCRFIDRIRSVSAELPFWQRLTAERAQEALAAALLHDVGHGPFSHLFEEAMPKGPSHEDWSARIVTTPSTEVYQVLAKVDPELPGRVAALIRGEHELPYLAHAVSGTFDVDRCDYLLRDAHFTGVSYGSFDLDWLLRSFCLAPPESPGGAPRLAVDGTKGLPAIESFTLARLFMFQQVYFHKASRASDWLVSRILARVRQLLEDGLRIEGVPLAVREIALQGDTELEHYLKLDDAIMWSAMMGFQEHPDPILSDLARRLISRRLLKAYELFGEDATTQGRARCVKIAKGLAEEAGLDPEIYVGLDAPSADTFDDSKDKLTVLFPDQTEHRPGEVSFLLGRLRGQTLCRPRVIYPPEIREHLLEELGRGPSPHRPGASRGTLAGASFSHASIPPGHHD
jgi:HD superfamily phosphohydrolase